MQKIIFLCLLFLSGCTSLELNSSEKFLKNYVIPNRDFELRVSSISSNATSPNFIQIRRVYHNASFEVAYNIANRDSLINITVKEDTVSVVIRGTGWADSVRNDSIKFSLDNKWDTQ
jgi:hypothetical protein